MLEIANLEAGYGAGPAVAGVNLRLAPGRLLVVLGRNGSGRSTLLRALVGLVKTNGSARLGDRELTNRPPWEIARYGIGYAPDTRDVFPTLSVDQNLRVTRPRACWCDGETLRDWFPVLRARASTRAGHLSGGEQKLLSLARAAQGATRLLLLDEPFEGLADDMRVAVHAMIAAAKRADVIVVVADTDDRLCRGGAEACLVLGAGAVRFAGEPADFFARKDILDWLE